MSITSGGDWNSFKKNVSEKLESLKKSVQKIPNPLPAIGNSVSSLFDKIASYKVPTDLQNIASGFDETHPPVQVPPELLAQQPQEQVPQMPNPMANMNLGSAVQTPMNPQMPNNMNLGSAIANPTMQPQLPLVEPSLQQTMPQLPQNLPFVGQTPQQTMPMIPQQPFPVGMQGVQPVGMIGQVPTMNIPQALPLMQGGSGKYKKYKVVNPNESFF